jgi:hypothetical protein
MSQAKKQAPRIGSAQTLHRPRPKPADPILPPMPLYAQLVEEKGTVALMTPVEPVPVKVTRRSNEKV